MSVVAAVGAIACAAPRALGGREAALGLSFSGSVLVPEQIRHVGVKAECAARVIAARCAGAWPARIAARGR